MEISAAQINKALEKVKTFDRTTQYYQRAINNSLTAEDIRFRAIDCQTIRTFPKDTHIHFKSIAEHINSLNPNDNPIDSLMSLTALQKVLIGRENISAASKFLNPKIPEIVIYDRHVKNALKTLYPKTKKQDIDKYQTFHELWFKTFNDCNLNLSEPKEIVLAVFDQLLMEFGKQI